jgi:2'-5' RNA ligase
LFFALWPDQDVRQGLVRIGQGLPRHAGRVPHPQDLHITLVFLGPVALEQYDCVLAAGRQTQVAPFDLIIDQVGYWKRPRILWCAPEQTPAALSELVSGLQNELAGCGFPPEKRPYSPHITLARKARPVPAQILSQPLHWRVADLVLVASHTGVRPPRYQVIKKWALDS